MTLSAGAKAAGKHVNMRIEGAVQGVGFRWWARAKAAEAGVRGFVRNEEDGSVHIEVEGDDEAVNRYIALCRQGPAGAHVENMSVSAGARVDFTGFDIRFR